MKKEKINYYCDMDGVLADFFGVANAVERFENEKDFFYNLKPIRKNVEFIKKLVKSGENVMILSASPNENADKDKIKWLKKYMPFMKKNKIIIMRVGENKANYVKTNGINVLFDDYGKNCREWNERKNHIAYKVKGVISL